VIDEAIVSSILGFIIAGYAIFSLWEFRVPPMNNHAWEWSLGVISGLLGGAYNIAGPTAVIYAAGRRWHPEKFKANLQTFALIISVFITASHAIARNYNASIFMYYALMLPAMLLGIFLGFRLDGKIKPVAFRRGVLILLLIAGLRLII